MIMTLTDLGIHFQKSKLCKFYVYFFHAIASTHQIYTNSAFKNYDIILSNGEYQSKIFNDLSATELEDAARVEVSKPSYQQVGGLACYPLESTYIASTAAESALVHNSISCAIDFGKTLLTYPDQDVLAHKLNSMSIDNYCFINGQITDIDNRTKDGFDVGKIIHETKRYIPLKKYF